MYKRHRETKSRPLAKIKKFIMESQLASLFIDTGKAPAI